MSFALSAKEECIRLISAKKHSDLKLDAVLCDIFNNLAHAMQEANKKSPNQKFYEYSNSFYGLKKTMVLEIIKECEKVGNTAYGLVKSSEETELLKNFNRENFVADIPGVRTDGMAF